MPPTLSFTANATSIIAGQPVTLNWQSSNATSVTITATGADGSNRSIPTNSQLSGSTQDKPTQNTTYTAVAAGAGNTSTQQQIKVTVTEPPPTLVFGIDKNSVTLGQAVTLTWQMTNGTSITITATRADGSTRQILAPTSQASGTASDSPAQDTTYTAAVTGAGNTSTQQQVKVTVTQPPPTLVFSADKNSIDFNQPVTLTWQMTNATSITITASGADGSAKQIVAPTANASGTVTDTPTQDTTYTAVATGAGNTSIQQQVQVTVAKPVAPQITQFSASPADVAAGTSTMLTWQTSNATSITITPDLPQVDGDESGPLPVANPKGMTIPVQQTTTYTMVAHGPGGDSQPTSVTITAVNVNLTVTPATIAPNTPNEQVTISWNVSGATIASLSIDNGVCSSCVLPQGSFTLPTPPSATTTYTATVTLQDGVQVQQTATLTVGSSATGTIKHIFFMVQENRSFDMYFGLLQAYRTQQLQKVGIQLSPSDTIESFNPNVVLTNHHSNVKVKPFHEQTERTENLTPSWDESHHNVALAGGDPAWQTTSSYTNSMFSMSNFLDTPNGAIGGTSQIDPNGTRALGYYDQDDLPYYYDLATFFATSDQWFSPVLTQTIPNRMYLFAGSSFGHEFADNGGHPLYSAKTIFRAMNEAKVSWLYYDNGGVLLADFQDWNAPHVQSQIRNITDLIGDSTAGTKGILQGNCSGTQCDPDLSLPQVIFIEDPSAGLNEHPEENIQQGAAYVQSIVNALLNSDAWNDSVFILTYDEGGGLYDHVPPIMVPPPDQYEQGQCPDANNGSVDYCKVGKISAPTSAQGGYDMFNLSGFRVPVIVISPFAKPHYVSHQAMDYTAILAFIERTFQIPACGTGTTACGLTKRDQWWLDHGDMQDFFDFTNPALLNSPKGGSWTSFLNAQPTNGMDNKNLETGGIQ